VVRLKLQTRELVPEGSRQVREIASVIAKGRDGAVGHVTKKDGVLGIVRTGTQLACVLVAGRIPVLIRQRRGGDRCGGDRRADRFGLFDLFFFLVLFVFYLV